MTNQSLYIIFTVEFLILAGFLWRITRARYFASLFFPSLVLLPSLYLLYSYLIKSSPDFLSTPLLAALAPHWTGFLKKATLIIPGIIGILLFLYLVSFFLLRPLLVKLNEFIFRLKKRILTSKEQRLSKVNYDIKRFYELINKDSEILQFFIALGKRDKPVYLNEKELTTHVEVVGPSGVGKTVSVLFPLAVQALLNDRPLIFVDGKGDSKLKNMFQTFCLERGIAMKFFDPLQPTYSHTYNPLLGTSDANELTNLLAVGLNLNAPGEAKVYTDIQKKFLSTLLHLFVETGQKFNFVDLVEYINHPTSRFILEKLIKNHFYKDEMLVFLSRLSKNEKELIGLATILDQLFVSDETISELINTYEPDIDIRYLLNEGGAVLFSFSAGMKAQTNEALAKMVLADIANAAGMRHADSNREHKFVLILLDEFGQYVSESFDKFISTARSANVSCIFSHQTNAQLETYFSKDRLARVVRENSSGKVIFRQSEEASFWAETFGTRQTMQRTEQVEVGPLLTEKLSQMGTLKEVDQFIVHPNVLRKLEIGQAVWKFREKEPEIVNLGMWPLSEKGATQSKIEHRTGSGLSLREKRMKEFSAKEAKAMKRIFLVLCFFFTFTGFAHAFLIPEFITTTLGTISKSVGKITDEVFRKTMVAQTIESVATLKKNYDESTAFYEEMKKISENPGALSDYTRGQVKKRAKEEENYVLTKAQMDFYGVYWSTPGVLSTFKSSTEQKIRENLDFSNYVIKRIKDKQKDLEKITGDAGGGGESDDKKKKEKVEQAKTDNQILQTETLLSIEKTAAKNLEMNTKVYEALTRGDRLGAEEQEKWVKYLLDMRKQIANLGQLQQTREQRAHEILKETPR